MNKKTLVILCMLITLIACFLTFFIFQKMSITQKTVFSMDVKVTDNEIIGVNVDTDALHFGSLMPGSSSMREVIFNNVEEDSNVQVIKKGNISIFINGPEKILAKKGENLNVTYSAFIPENAKVGLYSGELVFIFRKRQ